MPTHSPFIVFLISLLRSRFPSDVIFFWSGNLHLMFLVVHMCWDKFFPLLFVWKSLSFAFFKKKPLFGNNFELMGRLKHYHNTYVPFTQIHLLTFSPIWFMNYCFSLFINVYVFVCVYIFIYTYIFLKLSENKAYNLVSWILYCVFSKKRDILFYCCSTVINFSKFIFVK